MFGLKKIVPVLVATFALAIPSLALADDHDQNRGVDRRDEHGVVDRRDERAIAQTREEIARDRVELDRDVRLHRWAEAQRERREIERHEQQLRELLARR